MMIEERPLVDCDDLIDSFSSSDGQLFAKELTSTAPLADVVPAVHGQWYADKSFIPFVCTCSECGARYDIDGAFEWNYCPNCGVRMKYIDCSGAL